MLCLSRKKNQEIVIGDETIIVKVLKIRGDSVQIGVGAPGEMPIDRGETHQQMKEKRAQKASH